MILLVATLLVAASGYAESKDSLKVENVMSVENPERVTITESDNRLMVEIDGKKDNPSFRYVRESRNIAFGCFGHQRNVVATGILIFHSGNGHRNKDIKETNL